MYIAIGRYDELKSKMTVVYFKIGTFKCYEECLRRIEIRLVVSSLTLSGCGQIDADDTVSCADLYMLSTE